MWLAGGEGGAWDGWCACDDGTVVCADRSRVPMAASSLPSRPHTVSGGQILPQGAQQHLLRESAWKAAGVCRSDLLGSAQAVMRRALTQGRHSPNNTKGIRNAASWCYCLAPWRSAGAHASHVMEDSAEHSPHLARPSLSPCLLPKAEPQPPPSPCACAPG